MKRLFLFPILFLCLRLSAQLPEDALRVSWPNPASGSARQQAIGGAMGSLGGDISANFVNPAGLGLYRTSEIVLTSGWRFLKDKSSYLDKITKGSSSSKFNLGTSGLVSSHIGMNGASNVFSIAVNRVADFNSNVHYAGTNNYSSMAEQYAEELAGSSFSGNPDAGAASPGLSYGTRMALYTYLVDTATINGQLYDIAQPQKAGSLFQDNDLRSTGGITEIAISGATGFGDKWFIGGGLGVPIMQYDRYQTYRETDATGNTDNDFGSFTYQEHFKSRGVGLNAKLGILYKAGNALRFGFAVHTPTVYSVRDDFHASMNTSLENYAQPLSINSDSLDAITGNSPIGTIGYTLYSPWKLILSGSYLFGGESENVRQQKGFITADLEYTTTGGSRFKPQDEENASQDEEDYYDAINQGIKVSYKNTLGLRLGGELKFNTFMVRAGGAYYSSPYKDKELKADRMFLTAGAGYRNGGMFIDLAYVMGFTRDASFPYRLADKDNVVANLKEHGGTAVLTIGFKF